MKINPVKNNYISFANNKTPNEVQNKQGQTAIIHDKENPISKPLEQLDVVKASLIAGLGFGARALYYAFEDTDLLECTLDAGKKLAKKNHKNAAGGKLFALSMASWAAILIGTVGLLAGLYALFNGPKSMYQGKINAHKKAEEMDVYLAGNRIEQELYKQVGDQAKAVQTVEEQEHVKKQYAMLKAVKNNIPVFANFQSLPAQK